MNARNRVVLVGAVVLAVALVTGARGFTTATADRAVEIDVADDRAATLGIEQRPVSSANGSVTVDVVVKNQFPAGVDLRTVELSTNGSTATLAGGVPLRSGESRRHRFHSLSCQESITVRAAGPDVRVELTRPVSCP